KGWKKADGKPVLNVDVMKALDAAMAGRSVTFVRVKGHAGHELNDKADALANGAAKAHAPGGTPEAGPAFPDARAVGAGDDPAASAPAAAAGAGAGATVPARASAGAAAPDPDLLTMDRAEAAPAPARAGAVVELVVDLERSLLTDAVRGDRPQLAALLDRSWSHVCARGEL